MWPNARIGVMGQRTGRREVLAQVKREQADALGQRHRRRRGAKIRRRSSEQYEHQGHPLLLQRGLWDGVIDPRRPAGARLAPPPSTPHPGPTAFGVFRM